SSRRRADARSWVLVENANSFSRRMGNSTPPLPGGGRAPALYDPSRLSRCLDVLQVRPGTGDRGREDVVRDERGVHCKFGIQPEEGEGLEPCVGLVAQLLPDGRYLLIVVHDGAGLVVQAAYLRQLDGVAADAMQGSAI